jgi:hypothetical protein
MRLFLYSDHISPLANAASFSAAARIMPLFRFALIAAAAASPETYRFSFHWPSSIAACFSVLRIADSRAESNFQISFLACLPR